jgi:hypothetical protein
MAKKRLPATSGALTAEVLRVQRRWWEARHLHEVDLSAVQLGQAIVDVQKVAAAHLLRRFCNPATSETVRDTLALRVAPAFGIVLRHEVGTGHATTGLSEAQTMVGSSTGELSDVLSACGVSPDPAKRLQ